MRKGPHSFELIPCACVNVCSRIVPKGTHQIEWVICVWVSVSAVVLLLCGKGHIKPNCLYVCVRVCVCACVAELCGKGRIQSNLFHVCVCVCVRALIVWQEPRRHIHTHEPLMWRTIRGGKSPLLATPYCHPLLWLLPPLIESPYCVARATSIRIGSMCGYVCIVRKESRPIELVPCVCVSACLRVSPYYVDCATSNRIGSTCVCACVRVCLCVSPYCVERATSN